MRRALVLLVASALGAGCETVSWCGINTYRPLVMPCGASRYALFEAAERAARSLHPSHLEVAPDELRLAAIVNGREAGVRDRIAIAVSPDAELEVSVRTDVSDGTGGWIAATATCDGYQHSRERELGQRILAAVVVDRF